MTAGPLRRSLNYIIDLPGSGLECYVCHDQDGNHGKCLKTIRTCEPEEDRCLSIIRWSIQPYWSQVSNNCLRHNDKMIMKTLTDYFRVQRSSITFQSAAPRNMSATRRSMATWPSVITSGMKTGGAPSAARETDATTTSRQVWEVFSNKGTN